MGASPMRLPLARRMHGRGAHATKMNLSSYPTRRAVLAAGTAASLANLGSIVHADEQSPVIQNRRINQTVCQWCYGKMPVEELAQNAARMGLKGVDLVGPQHFATLKRYGLIGTMTLTHPIPKGLNR